MLKAYRIVLPLPYSFFQNKAPICSSYYTNTVPKRHAIESYQIVLGWVKMLLQVGDDRSRRTGRVPI